MILIDYVAPVAFSIPIARSTFRCLPCPWDAAQLIVQFHRQQLAACRRIDLAVGVVAARPRGGFRLSLRDVEQRPRVLGGNEQQRARGARRRTPSLFPVLQRSHRYSKQRRKPRLGKSSLSSDHRDIRHADHATVLAALDLAQPIQDLTAHISLCLSHLPLPSGSAGVCE